MHIYKIKTILKILWADIVIGQVRAKKNKKLWNIFRPKKYSLNADLYIMSSFYIFVEKYLDLCEGISTFSSVFHRFSYRTDQDFQMQYIIRHLVDLPQFSTNHAFHSKLHNTKSTSMHIGCVSHCFTYVSICNSNTFNWNAEEHLLLIQLSLILTIRQEGVLL